MGVVARTVVLIVVLTATANCSPRRYDIIHCCSEMHEESFIYEFCAQKM